MLSGLENIAVTSDCVSRSEMFRAVVEAPYKANVSDNLGSDVVLGVTAWCLPGVCRCNQNQEILSNISHNTKLCPAAWEAQSGRPVWL